MIKEKLEYQKYFLLKKENEKKVIIMNLIYLF